MEQSTYSYVEPRGSMPSMQQSGQGSCRCSTTAEADPTYELPQCIISYHCHYLLLHTSGSYRQFEGQPCTSGCMLCLSRQHPGSQAVKAHPSGAPPGPSVSGNAPQRASGSGWPGRRAALHAGSLAALHPPLLRPARSRKRQRLTAQVITATLVRLHSPRYLPVYFSDLLQPYRCVSHDIREPTHACAGVQAPGSLDLQRRVCTSSGAAGRRSSFAACATSASYVSVSRAVPAHPGQDCTALNTRSICGVASASHAVYRWPSVQVWMSGMLDERPRTCMQPCMFSPEDAPSSRRVRASCFCKDSPCPCPDGDAYA